MSFDKKKTDSDICLLDYFWKTFITAAQIIDLKCYIQKYVYYFTKKLIPLKIKMGYNIRWISDKNLINKISYDMLLSYFYKTKLL